MITTILLGALSALLLTALIVFIQLGMKAGRQIRAYEEFYQNTIQDVVHVSEMLERLMSRQLIADDPDVQNVHRVMVIFHDTLLGYINAGKAETNPKKAKKRR